MTATAIEYGLAVMLLAALALVGTLVVAMKSSGRDGEFDLFLHDRFDQDS